MTAFAESFERWFNVGLGFFYPEVCRLCEAEPATAQDGFVGARCWSQARFIKPPFCERCGLPFEGDITTPFECANCREMELRFTSARSAVVARGVVLEAIHRFKYQRQLWFENFLAGLFLREAAPALRGQNWNLIVPVPLHSVRQREREFNQAERLAARLSPATKYSIESEAAPAGHPHGDPNPADAAAAGCERARRVCPASRPALERRTGDSGGRRFHDWRDHQRVRAGIAGCGRG